MIKLLIMALVISAGCRLALGKWPWDFFRGPSDRSRAIFKARKLLSVRPGAGRMEVLEAHRKLIAVVHPDRGGSNAQVHEANAARDLLLEDLPDAN